MLPMIIYIAGGLKTDVNRRQDQGDADGNGGDGFDPGMAEVVPFVRRFTADPQSDQNDCVGGQVGKTVDGVGDQGAASAQDAGGEFQNDQYGIDRGADNCYRTPRVC